MDFPSPRLRALLIGLLLVAAPAVATPWPKSDIPADPAVSFGELPNGMRYAIMHNGTPSGAVSVRLRIAAGSLQEEKDQRGLAHFLEHMAFRGSANVPDGEVKNRLQRIGLDFGSDTNASTGQEETIYQFDLPRSDDASIDTALTLAREVAGNLTLSPDAAKTEAGVVGSEFNLRNLPPEKALQARLDFIFGKGRATQLPDGDPEVIAKASVGRIRSFYQAYYRPDRAVLVVVGDIDPARVKTRIGQVFSNWRGIGRAGSDPKLEISLKRGLEVQTFDGKGVSNSISVAWLSPPETKPETLASEKTALIEDIALSILNRRYRDVSVAPGRPFTRAGVSRSQEWQAVRMAGLTVGYTPGNWKKALTTAEEMRLAVLKDGVTQEELDRILTDMRSRFEQRVDSAATRSSRAIVNEILQEVGENDVYTSNARDLQTFNADVKDLSVETVNKALRDAFEGSGPLIFASGEQPIEGGADAVRAAWLEAEQAPPLVVAAAAARAEPAAPAKPWTYTDFGTPGAVVSTRTLDDMGATYLRFANGVRLTVRPSKFSANQVEVSVKIGNGRLGLPRDRMTAAWAASAFTGGALKDMTATEIQRSLTGRHYGVGFSIGDDGFVLSGGTTPDDLNLQMQVLAAYVKDPAFRPDSFERTRTAYLERLRQAGTDPRAVMQLKMAEILHDGDKRWASAAASDVENAKPEELAALLRPALENGAIDITIVGDTSVEEATKAVAATFGAFAPRSGTRALASADSMARFPAGGAPPVRLVTADQSGQEIASVVWPTRGRFPNIQEDVTVQLMADIMNDRLFDQLRGLGTVYVAQVGASSSKVFDYGYIQALAQLQPVAAQSFAQAVAQIVADIKAGKVTADELTRAREPELEALRRARESNGYWLSVLDDTDQHPEKLDLARKYESALHAVTIADIVAVANRYLDDPKALKLAVGPAA
jgi:zinc protease